MKIARYEKRVLSWVIDEIIPMSLGLAFVIISLSSNIVSDSWFVLAVIGFISAYIFYIFFTCLGLYVGNGFSLGLAVMGIKAINKDGEQLKFKDCLLRSILSGVVAFIILNAIYMLSVHTERSVFDRLSNTMIIEYRHAGD